MWSLMDSRPYRAAQGREEIAAGWRITYVSTFEGVADAVESGACQFGVLPVENSSNGSLLRQLHPREEKLQNLAVQGVDFVSDL